MGPELCFIPSLPTNSLINHRQCLCCPLLEAEWKYVFVGVPVVIDFSGQKKATCRRLNYSKHTQKFKSNLGFFWSNIGCKNIKFSFGWIDWENPCLPMLCSRLQSCVAHPSKWMRLLQLIACSLNSRLCEFLQESALASGQFDGKFLSPWSTLDFCKTHHLFVDGSVQPNHL